MDDYHRMTGNPHGDRAKCAQSHLGLVFQRSVLGYQTNLVGLLGSPRLLTRILALVVTAKCMLRLIYTFRFGAIQRVHFG